MSSVTDDTDTDDNYLLHLHTLPSHMHDAVVRWISIGHPHPRLMGHFFRAVLTNDLYEAVARADDENAMALRAWVVFFYNYAPSACYGSLAKIHEWHRRKFDEATVKDPVMP